MGVHEISTLSHWIGRHRSGEPLAIYTFLEADAAGRRNDMRAWSDTHGPTAAADVIPFTCI